MTRFLTASSPMARTPSRHCASGSRRIGSPVAFAATRPSSTCFDNGGLSYGGCGSSPTTVTEPVKPSSRSASAARNPASDAPTMTMRPSRRSRDAGTRLLAHEDRLDRARRSRLAHAFELVVGDGRVVPQRLLTMELEHPRREEHALGIGLAAVEVHDDPRPPRGRSARLQLRARAGLLRGARTIK